MELVRLLRHFINIQHWLENDTVTDWQTRLQRDRNIHLSIDAHSHQTPLNQILEWWGYIAEHEKIEDVGQDIVAVFKWSAIATAFIGIALGASTAFAVLRYDGSEPINIFVAMTVLVLVPALLLVVSLCLPFANPNGILGRLNLGSMVQSVIETRFTRLNYLHSFRLYGVENYLGWRFMAYSQIFGVAFALAALLVLMFKVTLTDLAFAWGTTLSIESSVIYEIVKMISTPWAVWYPAAAPGKELVEASQYYRLGDSAGNASASALTGWWRFLAASLLFYGLLLRSLLFIFARFNAKRSLERLFLSLPQSVALLERLQSAVIISSEEETLPAKFTQSGKLKSTPQHPLESVACVVAWHAAPVNTEIPSLPVFSINEQADLIEHKAQIESTLEGAGAVLVMCKGWEPPLLEFHDFLAALRELLGASPAIVVALVDENGLESPDNDKDVWRSSLSKINDANLYIQ